MINDLSQQFDQIQTTLKELLQVSHDLSPLQKKILSNALIELSQASTNTQTTLKKLHNQYQELAKRVDQEHRFEAIAQQVHQSLNSQDILDSATTGIRQVLKVDQVTIARLTDEGTAIAVASAPPLDQEFELNQTIHTPWTDISTFFCHPHKVQVVENVEQSGLPPTILNTFHQRQIKAILTIPITREDQILGLIYIYQHDRPRSWQSLEIELLQHLAGQVAIALHQSELYQQVQHLNAELEERVQQRTALVQQSLNFESLLKRITDKVRDSLDENQILQTVVQELTLVLGLRGCNSALYDLNQGTSTIRYEYTNSTPTYQGRVAHMDRFPEIYRQLQQGHYFQFCSLLPNPARGQTAMFACPIFVDPKSSQGIDQAVLGDLWLIHRKEYVFNEFEIRLVQQVANQCAIAIRQARLYQTAQVQVQELEKLNQLKDEFLSTVSHELRTPITNVKMAIHMLKIATTEERRQHYLSILEMETIREAELIDELLDLQRLEADSQPILSEETHVQAWLPEVIEPFQSRIADQQQILHIDCPDDLPLIATDVSILRRILAELINNACKYTASDNTITLTVRYNSPIYNNQELPPIMVFTIRNQSEIPPTELPHIFQKFYRVIQSDRYKRGGTGLGLALVQKRVEQLGGIIEVQSATGWTTFTVRLPLLLPHI